MRRIISTISTILILSILLFNQISKPIFNENEEEVKIFSDIEKTHWARESIYKIVKDYNLIQGFPDGTFKGERNFTRYEMAAILDKLIQMLDKRYIKDSSITIDPKFKEEIDKLKDEFKKELELIRTENEKSLNEVKELIEQIKRDFFPKVEVYGDISTLGSYTWIATNSFSDVQTPNGIYPARLSGINDFVSDKVSSFISTKLGVKSSFEKTYGEIRFSTGSDKNPTRSWVKMDNNRLNKFDININNAYIGLRPWGDIFDLKLGKFDNPFITTKLMFSPDIGFSGDVFTLSFGDKESPMRLRITGGVFWLTDDAPSSYITGIDRLAAMLAGQISLTKIFIDNLSFNIGYFHYMNTYSLINNLNNFEFDNGPINYINNPSTNDGNTIVEVKKTINKNDGTEEDIIYKDFLFTPQILNTNLKYKIPIEFPVYLGMDFIYNLGVNSRSLDKLANILDKPKYEKHLNENIGWGIILDVGEIKKQGDMSINFLYGNLAKDSTVGFYNDWPIFQGTNIRSFSLQISYMPFEHFTCGINGILRQRIIDLTTTSTEKGEFKDDETKKEIYTNFPMIYIFSKFTF